MWPNVRSKSKCSPWWTLTTANCGKPSRADAPPDIYGMPMGGRKIDARLASACRSLPLRRVEGRPPPERRRGLERRGRAMGVAQMGPTQPVGRRGKTFRPLSKGGGPPWSKEEFLSRRSPTPRPNRGRTASSSTHTIRTRSWRRWWRRPGRISIGPDGARDWSVEEIAAGARLFQGDDRPGPDRSGPHGDGPQPIGAVLEPPGRRDRSGQPVALAAPDDPGRRRRRRARPSKRLRATTSPSPCLPPPLERRDRPPSTRRWSRVTSSFASESIRGTITHGPPWPSPNTSAAAWGLGRRRTSLPCRPTLRPGALGERTRGFPVKSWTF